MRGITRHANYKATLFEAIDLCERVLKSQLEGLANLRKEVEGLELVTDDEPRDVRDMILASTIGSFDVVKHALIERLLRQ